MSSDGSKYETHVMSLIVKRTGEPIFSECATIVSVADEGAGPFVEVAQNQSSGTKTIQIDRGEWPTLRAAIDEMIGRCSQIGGDE